MTKVFLGKRIYQLIMPLLAILVVVVNGINAMSSGLILKHNINPRTTYMFLGNVALCDLMTGIALGIGSVFPRQYRNHVVCCIGQGMYILVNFIHFIEIRFYNLHHLFIYLFQWNITISKLILFRYKLY